MHCGLEQTPFGKLTEVDYVPRVDRETILFGNSLHNPVMRNGEILMGAVTFDIFEALMVNYYVVR